MADVTFECPYCSEINTISEYVDANLLSCQFCGKKLDFTSDNPADVKPVADKLKFREESLAEEPQPKVSEPQTAMWRFHSIRRKKRIIKLGKIHHFISWAIFIILGITMLMMRFGGNLTQDNINFIRGIGPVIVIGFHIYIVVTGFMESMFQGLFCLLVPFYSFYYFFIIDGNFYLRAIAGAVLLGIGFDSCVVIQKTTFSLITLIYTWLTSGVY